MILGTSKILSKSGPVDLLTITNMLQKIQEKYGIILENIIYANLGLKNRTFPRKCMSYVPEFLVFFCLIRLHL